MSDIPFSVLADGQYAEVVDAFRNNFEEGIEHGASFCVFQDGEKIIDLKGGWANKAKTEAISDHHLFSIFSSGKAVAAIIIAHLADQDLLGYDQPVSSFWPELRAVQQCDLTVAQLMSHQAGLSGVTNPEWTPEDWFDWKKTIAELSSQNPIFEPGSASGYSPVTFGFLAGEVARRMDEFGRHLGEILRQDICEPHSIDVWIGLPESEHGRCVEMQKPKRLADLGEINAATKAAFLEKWSSPGRRGVAAWRSAQLAGSNCHATAEGLALLMQVFNDGSIDGEMYLSEDVREKLTASRILGPDQVLPFDVNFAAGIMRNHPNYFYGPNPNTVGHSGWGGSCVFADPDAGVSAAYVMTRQDNSLMGDPRSLRIIEALYEVL